MMTDDIRAVQRLLGALGHPVAVDGVWGTASRLALSEAHKSATGQVPIFAAQPKATRPISELIFHCSATPEGREVSVETITAWHKARDFATIGYHYVVHLDGEVEAGRSEATIGAHVLGHNVGTLGVVYVGGTDADGKAKDTRTAAQKVALIAVRDALMVKYPTIKKVSGHNQYAAKACPSFYVPDDPLGEIA
jgi:N-acetylmuramoyl-L-alanine amidase